MMKSDAHLPVVSPEVPVSREFKDAKAAVARLQELYQIAVSFLTKTFSESISGEMPKNRFRAFYPEIRIRTTTFAQVDTRLSFGHVAGPGIYATTVTRPDLFEGYLLQQIGLLIENHDEPIVIGVSTTPMPVHFAVTGEIAVPQEGALQFILRDVFDVPDLTTTNDDIVNGLDFHNEDGSSPLAPFTAQRIDYSLHRLSHYTATSANHVQNFVLFTNYQFYIDEFIDFACNAIKEPKSGYDCFVEPGNKITHKDGKVTGEALTRLPQMPAYHLKRPGRSGITMINIGVGPSNAKTITDHVAVLRPHTWLMLGHCAGLRNSQRLGDYVLAHAYVREDHVLDADLPLSVPIPALAEVQVALEQAVSDITALPRPEIKRIMRTGTVATFDNRNWELRDQRGPVQRLSQSRAIALDMESATIAANGFRFRVPYGTLLCVSDKPLHGELKLPGMATDFYSTQVRSHLEIGIRALEHLREMPPEQLHSRKLRSFSETAFQ